ncbi:MAG: hypothetical protein QW745_08045 [Thermoplasmata archaeon]|uniref:hypothetical protein n=1 Tax=Metallosphaera sp. TaxID=2020860 RepID=UPI00317F0F90
MDKKLLRLFEGEKVVMTLRNGERLKGSYRIKAGIVILEEDDGSVSVISPQQVVKVDLQPGSKKRDIDVT